MGGGKARLLFATIFSLSFFVSASSVHGKTVPDPSSYSSPASGEIKITASVPVSPFFAYTLAKNSNVEIDIVSPTVGDIITIRVHLLGPRDTLLKNHRLQIELYDVNQTVLYREEAKTTIAGIAEFNVLASEEMIGKVVVSFTDITYQEPIKLKATVEFDIQSKNVSTQSNPTDIKVSTHWVIDIYIVAERQSLNILTTQESMTILDVVFYENILAQKQLSVYFEETSFAYTYSVRDSPAFSPLSNTGCYWYQ